MFQAFAKYRSLRIAILLAVLGGFSSGCFFDRDHDRDHDHHEHHDHDWDEHHY